MPNLKHITILHSNDIHGQFALQAGKDGTLQGGIAYLAGYINKVRSETDNVVYAIAGDMVQGMALDKLSQGMASASLLNSLHPDIATVGNHEVDYGLARLLVLEKLLAFPVVCANIHVSVSGKPVFKPCKILEVGGARILFVGLTTDELQMHPNIADDASEFIRIDSELSTAYDICKEYEDEPIDAVVLLTHIGIDQDRLLAEFSGGKWGIDFIIGGHTHTFLKEPSVVNGIPIVQAGMGTTQVGRLDIIVDIDEHCICSYTWEPIDIGPDTCPVDDEVDQAYQLMKEQAEANLGRVVGLLPKKLTHRRIPGDTPLAQFVADTCAQGLDAFIVNQGYIRSCELGPMVTEGDLMRTFSFINFAVTLSIKGKGLLDIIDKFLTHSAMMFVPSRQLEIWYDIKKNKCWRCLIGGKPLEKERFYKIGMPDFVCSTIMDAMDSDWREAMVEGEPKVNRDISDIVADSIRLGSDFPADNSSRIHFLEEPSAGTPLS